MKIQLDTVKKTIKLEEDVKISSFVTLLKKLLPNNEWKQFTLQTNTTFQQITYPVIIKEYPYRENPQPWITWYSNTTNPQEKSDYRINAGVYDLEVSNNLLL